MKETKRQWKSFAFFDFDGITAHLEKMAAEGWMIEQNKNRHWVYRRIQPKKLKFAVTYFPKASDFDPFPTEELQTFNDFCASAGWKPAVSWGQLQIYYNENENPIPIETDPVVQVNTIHAAMKKNFIPSYLLLMVLSTMVIAMHTSQIFRDPIGSLSSTARIFSIVMYLLLMLVSAVDLYNYFSWYKRARLRARDGLTIPSGKTAQVFQWIVLGIVFLLVGVYYASMIGKIYIWFMLLMGIMFSMAGVIAVALKEYMKKHNVSRNTNIAVSFGAAFIITMALIFFSTMYIIRNDISISPQDSQPVGTYTKWNMTWDIYNDPVPLRLEDFMPTDYDKYSVQNRPNSSIFLSEFKVDQSATIDDENVPELYYHLVKVKMDFLYDWCFDAMFYDMDDSKDDSDMPPEYRAKLIEQDAAPWQADKVYRLYYDSYYLDRWLVCWDNKIVELRFDTGTVLTDSQKNIIGEKLKNL